MVCSRVSRIGVGVFVLLVVVCSSACRGTQARNLKITEVGKRAIEMQLAEPAGGMKLGGSFTLSVRTSTGTASSLPLGTFTASIPAGGYFMVWSEAGYGGPITVQPFSGGQQGAVPGIKVPSSFFADMDSAPSEVRILGSRNRVSGMLAIFPLVTKDTIDDVVRFGQPPGDRPVTGGTFTSDGSLTNPSGSTSLAREWWASRPLDTDREADWRDEGTTSWGVPTP
jgi:hypothetical protein